jgi:hypothetical protein
MSREEQPTVSQSSAHFSAPEEPASKGHVVSVPEDDMREADFEEKIDSGEADRLRRVRDRTADEMRAQSRLLAKEASRRLRRYRVTRICTVVLMLSALLGVFYSTGMTLGFDSLLTRITPVIIAFATLFYVIEAFLRDYEVALQSARESERLSNLLRVITLDWEIKGADDDIYQARALLERFKSSESSIGTIIEAEQVPSISVFSNLLRTPNVQSALNPHEARSRRK